MATSRLRVVCVCASNQNRSMEAHNELALRGYHVQSCGTGSSVKLPGRTAMEPVVYPFNVPYEHMRTELKQRDEALYTNNGVLAMLERNAKIKRAPEQWRDARERADIVITFEERVFEAVLEDFVSNRSPISFAPAYVINLEVRDTHSEAAVGAKLAVDLVEAIANCEDIDKEIYDITEAIEKRSRHSVLVAPVFY